MGRPRAVAAAFCGFDTALGARAAVQRHVLPERRTDFDLMLAHRPTCRDGQRVERPGTSPGSATRRRVDADLPGPVGTPLTRP